MTQSTAKLHILFENHRWLPPLEDALIERGVPYQLHFLEGGTLDLSSTPPKGVFLNRMSPSSHTRGHQGGVRHAKDLLLWLEAHGRRVINGSKAFDLELSKVRQDLALRAVGIRTPRTIAVVGRDNLKKAARHMLLPFITKHNQGGKGLGVKLFRDLDAFDAHVDSPDFVDDPGGVTLLQQYIQPVGERITRVEIVDGELVYAMHSSTEDGFELCPAVECSAEDAFCPIGDIGKFTLASEFSRDDDLVERYTALMQANDIDMAGIEFVQGADGHRYTYDINGTTNFNEDVQGEAGVRGMSYVARLAERLLLRC
ncbi:MAG: glutathione synthase/RimK-type ligase-like ATP-grasp enzyme [Kiritimatiellia bacterium]|jgi:glutathione synthase/RimK-type ligase-like ATP-grasp enzyme